MISIPVMTDETVVRRNTNANVMGAAAGADDAYDYQADAATREDGGGAAAAAAMAAAAAAGGVVPVYHTFVHPNAQAAMVVNRNGMPVLESVPAYFSAALPCSNSILDVGPAPAPMPPPADVAPPEMPPLAQYCALALQYRCDRSQEQDQNVRSCFHSSRIPSITLWDYVRRFAKYSLCSEECFIVALILMDRYVAKTQVPITLRNVHRLYITAMTLSVKLRDDSYYSNAYYASIGGVMNAELNVLELELLDTMQWFTWVEKSAYDSYTQRLEALFSYSLPPRAAALPPR